MLAGRFPITPTEAGRRFTVSPAVSGKTEWNLDVDGMLDPAPGTYTLTPLSTYTANVDLSGGGGGGGGGMQSGPSNGSNGGDGGQSKLGTITANGGLGGKGGYFSGTNESPSYGGGENGANGTASGGDTNTTGGGALGGSGGSSPWRSGGTGGRGGRSQKTALAFTTGVPLTLIVGVRGGAGNNGAQPGQPGWGRIS